MSKRDWNYALHIKGVRLESLDMSRLAEYLKEFAQLLGPDAKPTLTSIVKGSVVLRAQDRSGYPVLTGSRIRQAAANPQSPARPAFEKITSLLRRDSARAEILDHEKNVVVSFTPRKPANDEQPEFIVQDESEIDGVVVGVSGADDTAHVRLQGPSGATYNVTVRDMELARQLATRFRGSAIRLHTHGSWKRTSQGQWEPHALYADRFEDLDQQDAHGSLLELASIPGNGWANVAEAENLWKKIRGLDDSGA